MVFIDYYKELGISDSSSLAEVQASIKENRRRYRTLTGSPNIDQRSLAERKMVIFNEAEKIFSSELSKQTYDSELDAFRRNNGKESDLDNSTNINGTVDELLERARLAQNNGSIRSALVFAKKATEVAPRHLGAWILLGYLAEENKDYELVEEVANEILFLDRSNAEGYVLLGSAHRNQRRYDLAIKQYEMAYAVSHDSGYLLSKGTILDEIGRGQEAGQLFEELAHQFLTTDSNGSIKEAGEKGQLYLRLAMYSYGKARLYGKVQEIGELLTAYEPSFDNLADYADNIADQTKKGEIIKIIFEKYGQEVPRIQRNYLVACYQEKMEKYFDSDSVIEYNSRKKMNSLKEYLDEMRQKTITDPEARRYLQEHTERYNYLNKKVFSNVGCLGWIVVLFLIGQVLHNVTDYTGSFFMAIVYGVLLYLFVTTFVYAPRWKRLNKK